MKTEELLNNITPSKNQHYNYTYTHKSANAPNREELSFLDVFAFPKLSNNGFAFKTYNLKNIILSDVYTIEQYVDFSLNDSIE